MGSRLTEDERSFFGPHWKPRIRHRYGLADRFVRGAVVAAGTSGGAGIP